MKSIFIRNVYEQDYELECSYYINGCVKSIRILPIKSNKLIRQETIMKKDIDFLLKNGEEIYDNDLDKIFVVNDIKKTTDNEYLYIVESISEETKNSIERKEYLENKITDCNKMINKLSELKSENIMLNDLVYQLKKKNKELQNQIPYYEPKGKSLFSKIFNFFL